MVVLWLEHWTRHSKCTGVTSSYFAFTLGKLFTHSDALQLER